MLQADFRSAVHFAAAICYVNPVFPSETPGGLCGSGWRRRKKRNILLHCNRVSAFFPFPWSWGSTSSGSLSPTCEDVKAAKVATGKTSCKPFSCTADELHFVPIPGTDWRLALWRYLPTSDVPARNHPLLLLSGVGTNAIGFDLAPESSFARYMSRQGFDTWILEMRGAGLSTREREPEAVQKSADNLGSVDKSVTNGSLSSGKSSLNTIVSQQLESSIVGNRTEKMGDRSQLAIKLAEMLLLLTERVSGFLSDSQSRIMSAKFFDQISKLFEDAQLSERFNDVRRKFLSLLESRQNSAVALQIRDLSQRLVNIIEEGQRSVSLSPQFFDVQERLYTIIENFQKQLDLFVKYDWDFENYLEDDVPAAIEYIRTQSKPKDGKLLAIGHSMGGILLYAMLSRYGFEGKTPGLVAVVTLASSLDYASSNSSLKLLLPIVDPAQALNVPVVPLGSLLAAAYPLACRPPYVLSWLNPHISAEGMMHPELYEKLVLNNFCTIPCKLLLQLTTVFQAGGLRNRSGTFCYKDHLRKSNVPILALAGDQDLICPPEAVYETVKIIPPHLVTYKVLGGPDGPHYGHYDLVGGRLAIDQVYPCLLEFLTQHDK